MSARVFVTSLMVETTKYTLGLTATPIVKIRFHMVYR
jgi:hypothetical protein